MYRDCVIVYLTTLACVRWDQVVANLGRCKTSKPRADTGQGPGALAARPPALEFWTVADAMMLRIAHVGRCPCGHESRR